MSSSGFPRLTPITRRQFMKLAGYSAVALPFVLLRLYRVRSSTWRLHEDTDRVGIRKLYTGSHNHPGCDTGENADCPGPNRMSCYWGALYVNSVSLHRLRTGPFTGGCNAEWPGTGNAERVRWVSHPSASIWQPEYRLMGRLYVYDIMERPQPWSGLVLHPVHMDNCNNYWIRLWERDNPRQVVWGKEVDDAESWIGSWTLPQPPQLQRWYDYEVRVLPESRLKFYWNRKLIFDHIDPERSFSQGPVGMRLDYFDTVLDDTRVYQP
jgi:hypothetical protein